MNKPTAWLFGLVALNLVVLSVAVIGKQEVVRDVVRDSAGAISSPDIQSNYFSYGGVRHWGVRTESLIQASTTVCALQGPAATSSLRFASIRLNVSSTTASNVNFGVGPTPYAISTAIGGQAVAANAKADVVATSTLIVSPNAYVVFTMSGGTGTFSPTGNCEATWIEL